jgi:uncharacterized membrane protein
MNDPLHGHGERSYRGETVPAAPDPERSAKLRTLTHVLYALYAVSWLTGGATALIAAIIGFIKRDDAAGTPYEAHIEWQLHTFIWALIWGGLGFVLMVLVVGVLIWWAAGVWVLYRIIKGWLYLYDNKPLPLKRRATASRDTI